MDRFDARVSDRAQTLQRVLKSLEKAQSKEKAEKQHKGESCIDGNVTSDADEACLQKRAFKSEMFDLKTRQRQLEFLLKARQLRLLSELQSIYPIAKITGLSGGLGGAGARRQNRRVSAFDEWLTDEQEERSDKYGDQAMRQMSISEALPTRGLSVKRSRDPRNSEQLLSIRGLILPMRDMLSHEEEQVSTALGYVAHLVHLLAKVFQIALRYETMPGGSRSRIRNCLPLKTQAEYLEYPLYWRGVSRWYMRAVCVLYYDVL